MLKNNPELKKAIDAAYKLVGLKGVAATVYNNLNPNGNISKKWELATTDNNTSHHKMMEKLFYSNHMKLAKENIDAIITTLLNQIYKSIEPKICNFNLSFSWNLKNDVCKMHLLNSENPITPNSGKVLKFDSLKKCILFLEDYTDFILSHDYSGEEWFGASHYSPIKTSDNFTFKAKDRKTAEKFYGVLTGLTYRNKPYLIYKSTPLNENKTKIASIPDIELNNNLDMQLQDIGDLANSCLKGFVRDYYNSEEEFSLIPDLVIEAITDLKTKEVNSDLHFQSKSYIEDMEAEFKSKEYELEGLIFCLYMFTSELNSIPFFIDNEITFNITLFFFDQDYEIIIEACNPRYNIRPITSYNIQQLRKGWGRLINYAATIEPRNVYLFNKYGSLNFIVADTPQNALNMKNVLIAGNWKETVCIDSVYERGPDV